MNTWIVRESGEHREAEEVAVPMADGGTCLDLERGVRRVRVGRGVRRSRGGRGVGAGVRGSGARRSWWFCLSVVRGVPNASPFFAGGGFPWPEGRAMSWSAFSPCGLA